MLRKVWLVELEAHENRYTKQWATEFPKYLELYEDLKVERVNGSVLKSTHQTSSGAFLNWAGTNYYKAVQAQELSALFAHQQIGHDDIILFADFWNPVILQVRYMITMLGLNTRIAALAHAGVYDPADLLHQKSKRDYLTSSAYDRFVQTEKAIVQACDVVYFATEFHQNLFRKTHPEFGNTKVVGFPFEYVRRIEFPQVPKENLIIFTQRNSPEKNPQSFDSWERAMPQYKFVNVQKLNPTKVQYHEWIAKAKLMLSFADQETLGITPFEALAGNCMILVPNRLSYEEMYTSGCKYQSKDDLAIKINNYMDLPDETRNQFCKAEFNSVRKKYFSCEEMAKDLINL